MKNKAKFPYIYEAVIWLMYVVLYKYDYYVDNIQVSGTPRGYFPYQIFILFAIATSLYMILYYRWLAPLLIRRKKYWLFALMVIVFFGYISKVNYTIWYQLFDLLNQDPKLNSYFAWQKMMSIERLKHLLAGWDLRILATDFVTFTSVFLMRYAYETEEKKHQLETDNLVLQLNSLKAQLHPHFLFNTLNSLYGMSLVQSPETPAFILRLSDMLRFVLYDCQQNKVLLSKDVEFLLNYIEMEKKRYPDADISFRTAIPEGDEMIASLLLINFIENSFKHGAHRVRENGFVRGELYLQSNTLVFILENDILDSTPASHPYSGIGIGNVKKRLALYYPGQHDLQIENNGQLFRVTLRIQLNNNL